MNEQGVIKCWLEINSTLEPPDTYKIWDITPQPPQTFEVRICVFNCKDVEIMDWEGTSDVYCRGFFDSKEDVQETDTHYRNQDGKPDFQYRLVYRIQNDRNSYNYTLQMYDRDLFKSSDLIGEMQINLKQIIDDCSLVKKPITLNESYYTDVLKKSSPYKNLKMEFDKDDKSRFWVQMMKKDPKSHAIKKTGMAKV